MASPSRFKDDDYPVEQVDWYDVIEACARLTAYTGRTYRLPSEAEWEYACRARTTTPFHFGETITPEIVIYDGSSPYGDGPTGKDWNQTREVHAALYANDFGLFEMHGNVWEWCEDDFHTYTQKEQSDGKAWIDQPRVNSRILRGGSFGFKSRTCRSAYRGYHPPETRESYVGFRVVADIDHADQSDQAGLIELAR